MSYSHKQATQLPLSNDPMDYWQKDHGFNNQPDLSEPDNENGIVQYGIYKSMARMNELGSVIGELMQVLYNEETGYYSRYNTETHKTEDHMSIDNLIALAEESEVAAKRIWAKLLENQFRYDDVNPENPSWSRLMILRPDFLYFISKRAGSRISWMFYLGFLIMRLHSSYRVKVSRPTIYGYIGAHIKKFFGMEHSEQDLQWKRYTYWDVSGKALTIIMLRKLEGHKFLKRFLVRRLRDKFGGIEGLMDKYFKKHSRVDCNPILIASKRFTSLTDDVVVKELFGG